MTLLSSNTFVPDNEPLVRPKLSGVADPRQAPLIGVDSQLPAVSASAQSPAAMRARFAMPPQWSPEVMRENRFTDRASADAAVLIPIVLRREPMVLLTERSANLSTHSGQIAFPGGRRDPEDTSPEATALREAHEEVGLAASAVEVIGRLPVYVTGSAFIITPVVGLVDPRAQLSPNPGEVADVFEVPLAFLLNPAHHERHAMLWQGVQREWFAMPYQDEGKERYIWGATAGMLRNLYRFLVV